MTFIAWPSVLLTNTMRVFFVAGIGQELNRHAHNANHASALVFPTCRLVQASTFFPEARASKNSACQVNGRTPS